MKEEAKKKAEWIEMARVVIRGTRDAARAISMASFTLSIYGIAGCTPPTHAFDVTSLKTSVLTGGIAVACSALDFLLGWLCSY